MKTLIRILTVLLCGAVLLIAVFLAGRYGWELGGFRACQSAGIEEIFVEENQVRIRGFYPGSFPQGFIGCHAQQVDSTLYVGFKFSGLFGFFETGDFDISIPTRGTVSQVVVKTGEQEYPIWPAQEEPGPSLPTETTSVPTEGTSPTEKPAVPTAYENILSLYRKALEEKWRGQELLNAGLNFMIADVEPETVGYAVKDLDDNGIPELAIGTLSGDEFYGKLLFVLYTLDKDGQPMQLFSSIERDRFYYAGGSRFANIGFSDLGSSFVTTLKLQEEGLVDMTFTTDPTAYVQMELTSLAPSRS